MLKKNFSLRIYPILLGIFFGIISWVLLFTPFFGNNLAKAANSSPYGYCIYAAETGGGFGELLYMSCTNCEPPVTVGNCAGFFGVCGYEGILPCP